MSNVSRALKLDTDGSITEVKIGLTFPQMNIDTFGEDRLIERVAAVGLERWNVHRPQGAKRAVMIVDESGLYYQEYKFNVLASILYGYTQHSRPIVGPAYLVGETHEDFTGLHESFTAKVVEDLVSDFVPMDAVRLAITVLP